MAETRFIQIFGTTKVHKNFCVCVCFLCFFSFLFVSKEREKEVVGLGGWGGGEEWEKLGEEKLIRIYCMKN